MKYSILSIALLSLLNFSACNRINSASSDTSIEKPKKDYAEPPQIDLINARWILREIEGKPVKQKSDVYIRFADKVTVEGFLGCNKFNGKYVTDGADIKIGPIMSTKMACEDDAIENQFARVLEQAASYSTDDKYLYLKNDDGVLAKLEAIYL
ncbi:MAG: META domain-containing protein [Cytophagaceae bacterium]|nr:META domain-containing protein [Cytophagaceae bacterium]